MRKYSLAYLTVFGTDPVNQIRIAAETGYDYVSLRTIPLGLPGEPEFLLDKDERLFRSVKQALSECNIPLMDIELARIRPDLDIAEYEPAFEKAAELGASDVLGSIWTRKKEFYTNATAEVAAMAKRFGLNYNIEFLPWAGVRSLQEVITLIDDIGTDNLFVMVDTLHASRAGVSAAEIKRTDKKYFRFMHICDGSAGSSGDMVLDDINDEFMLSTAREGRLYAGQGGIDIAGMVKAIPGVPLSVESPNTREMRERGASGHARKCLEIAKEYFAAHDVE